MSLLYYDVVDLLFMCSFRIADEHKVPRDIPVDNH